MYANQLSLSHSHNTLTDNKLEKDKGRVYGKWYYKVIK